MSDAPINGLTFCGSCLYGKPLDPRNLGGPNLSCYRYPPTAVPLFDPRGNLTGTQGLYPLVQRSTPGCGEYRIKPGLVQ